MSAESRATFLQHLFLTSARTCWFTYKHLFSSHRQKRAPQFLFLFITGVGDVESGLCCQTGCAASEGAS